MTGAKINRIGGNQADKEEGRVQQKIVEQVKGQRRQRKRVESGINVGLYCGPRMDILFCKLTGTGELWNNSVGSPTESPLHLHFLPSIPIPCTLNTLNLLF